MQKHWHACELLSHGYCAVANKPCCRHVLLSPHSTMADLMLWGSFRGHTFLGKAYKLWCFWTLSALLPTCCSAALFLLSWSGASQEHQMSLSEAHVCRPYVQQAQWTCACIYISDSQAIQGQKIHQISQFHSLSQRNLGMPLPQLSLT